MCILDTPAIFIKSTSNENRISYKNITLDDIMKNYNPVSLSMKTAWEKYQRNSLEDEQLTYEGARLNQGMFNYESIRDKQLKKEMWVNIGLTVLSIGVGVFCPPAGAALGIALGALNLASAGFGKDFYSGRELSNKERIARAGFGLLSMGAGIFTLLSFSKNVSLVQGTERWTLSHAEQMLKNSSRANFKSITQQANALKALQKASGADRPQTMEEFLKEMDELPRARLSKKVEDGLVSTPNGKRLDPSVYMSKAEIEAHLSLFDDGVVRVQSKENFDFAINTYGPNIGDPKTGTYVMPKSVADKAISVADGNPRILEELLGLEPMSLGENPVLLDIQKTTNMRVPSGNESGAWQGLWEPGGFTNGGIPEAVVDTIKGDEYIVKNVFK